MAKIGSAGVVSVFANMGNKGYADGYRKAGKSPRIIAEES